MRKILLLGLVALALSSMSTLLFAGYPACDEGDMKQTLKDLGVYGWCNAWHEAVENEDDDAEEEIRIKVLAKLYPDYDELPWVDGDSEIIQFRCKCWNTFDECSIRDLMVDVGTVQAQPGYGVVSGTGDIYNGSLLFVDPFYTSWNWFGVTPLDQCVYSTAPIAPNGGDYQDLTPGEADECGWELGIIASIGTTGNTVGVCPE